MLDPCDGQTDGFRHVAQQGQGLEHLALGADGRAIWAGLLIVR